MLVIQTMRILGLDYGEKTIGVAISDPLGLTAQGLFTLRITDKQSLSACLGRLAETIQEYGVSEIVLGFPKNMNNTCGPQAKATLGFKEKLEKRTGLPVHLVDERLSTVCAERALLEADVSRGKRKRLIDTCAAAIILGAYLENLYQRKKAINISHDGLNEPNNELNESDWDESVIVITDDTGREIEFCIIDELEHEKKRYLLVVESDQIDDDEAEAVILKEIGEDEKDYTYTELDDDEFETIAKLFDQKLDDYDVEV